MSDKTGAPSGIIRLVTWDGVVVGHVACGVDTPHPGDVLHIGKKGTMTWRALRRVYSTQERDDGIPCLYVTGLLVAPESAAARKVCKQSS